jgi:hypothetical protein
MIGTAEFSPCGRYRYALTRQWANTGLFDDGPLRTVNFIMLNPSTADDSVNDPTVSRCIRFAQDWGYGRLVVTKLFAFRATDSREMKAASDPVGPDNDESLLLWAGVSELVVCAWGLHGTHQARGSAVQRLLSEGAVVPHCLKLTKDGFPSHPLYLPQYLQPFRWGLFPQEVSSSKP